MGLLRQLALAFPAAFPDLAALTDTDPELDFWNNVAHLQLHRRSRAFLRLQRVRMLFTLCSLVLSAMLFSTTCSLSSKTQCIWGMVSPSLYAEA